ncbi:MAG TPA: 3-phosphoshikimate 1-carboxyvinyltransferase [Actinomycetota bacterium]|nr:3-phosphoshikimate 1-carboxyvinyltransferase [Actinomycetota bacterium]
MRRRKPAAGAAAPLTGSVSVPGDKSISHRALILSALAEGVSSIGGLNPGGDVRATAGAVAALGARVDLEDDSNVHVEGYGLTGLREPRDVVDLGNSGTSMRTLLGVCAGIDGLTVLTGDDSLRSRPMLRVAVPLRQMGAVVDGRSYGELPPIVVRGGSLRAIDAELNVASAQVKTAILLAGLRAEGRTTVVEPGPSRDHTERMLAAAGVEVARTGTTCSVDGGSAVRPLQWDVPGDTSSALYLLVAALLVRGSELTVTDVLLNPTRTAALDVLARMGADVRIEEKEMVCGEPRGDVTARASSLTATTIEPEEVPALIDELPLLAVAASQAEGTTVVAGAGELRVKESDRITAMVGGLRALGAAAEERPDGFAIEGPAPLAGGAVDSFGDHRVAMSFAIAGLISAEGVRVSRWSCVDTSFPGFLDVLGRAQGRFAPK